MYKYLERAYGLEEQSVPLKAAAVSRSLTDLPDLLGTRTE